MKPILCLDFDGVIHSYVSGWRTADVVTDPPVPGAVEFIRAALKHFTVAIHSSRSHQPGGIAAMQAWLAEHSDAELVEQILWPDHKPPAWVTLDDRAVTFTGTWPDIATLLAFEPWFKHGHVATGASP